MSHNCKIVGNSFEIPEMHRSLLFFVLTAFTVPRFDDYLYYYKTGPAGFSQFTYSVLTLIGTACLLVGIAIYQKWFTKTETRTMMILSGIFMISASFMDLAFVCGWNLKLGIPDLAWVLFGSTAMNTMLYAFMILPPGVLYAKMTPAHVEATIYAFTSSITTAVFPISKIIGALINLATFNVTENDLSNLWKLYVI